MVDSFVSKILEWLTTKGDISEDEYELYQYAIICLFSLCAPLFFSILIGHILRKEIESILMIIPFICIRKFAGGYHSKKFRNCIIASIIIIVSFINIGIIINYKMVIVFGIISSLGLLIFSPIDSNNRRLNDIEKKTCKRIVLIFIGVIWIIVIKLTVWKMDEYAKYMALGIVLSFILQLPIIIRKLFNKSNSNLYT